MGGFGAIMGGMIFCVSHGRHGSTGGRHGWNVFRCAYHTPSHDAVEDLANTFRASHDDAARDNEEEEEESSSDGDDESEEEEDEDDDEA